MRLGTHLHAFWQRRRAVAVCATIALIAALATSGNISLFPPGFHGRANEIAAASTQALVDSRYSGISDVRANTYDLTSMTNRATLLGNVMASEPVRIYIAARAGVPAQRIQAVAPVTANVPRALTEPGSEKRASDILRSTDQYRLDIQTDPTVPVLNIYSQAPTPREAERLANAAVTGLRAYLADVAANKGIGPKEQVRIEQLGSARGGVINKGVGLQIALLTFLVVFALGGCAVLLLERVRRGWQAAARSERAAAVGEPATRPRPRADAPMVAHGNGRGAA
jgi:hypothetical protein